MSDDLFLTMLELEAMEAESCAKTDEAQVLKRIVNSLRQRRNGETVSAQCG